MEFKEVDILDWFTVSDEFGEAVFMKRTDVKSICIESKNGTYEKGREYGFLLETIVKLD